jgi:hypothetical protein
VWPPVRFQPLIQVGRANAPTTAYPISRQFTLMNPTSDGENGDFEAIRYFFRRHQGNGF